MSAVAVVVLCGVAAKATVETFGVRWAPDARRAREIVERRLEPAWVEMAAALTGAPPRYDGTLGTDPREGARRLASWPDVPTAFHVSGQEKIMIFESPDGGLVRGSRQIRLIRPITLDLAAGWFGQSDHRQESLLARLLALRDWGGKFPLFGEQWLLAPEPSQDFPDVGIFYRQVSGGGLIGFLFDVEAFRRNRLHPILADRGLADLVDLEIGHAFNRGAPFRVAHSSLNQLDLRPNPAPRFMQHLVPDLMIPYAAEMALNLAGLILALAVGLRGLADWILPKWAFGGLPLGKRRRGRYFGFQTVYARDVILAAVERQERALQAGAMEVDVVADYHLRFQGNRDILVESVSQLISNAIEFARDEKRILVTTTREGDSVVFGVRDFGPGIAFDQQSRIFRPYFRIPEMLSKAIPGVGLGLSLVHAAALAHDGRAGVVSSPGKGSLFSIKVPDRKA